MTGPDRKDRDETLQDRVARLPRELPPSRDLWPSVAARIAGSKPANRSRRIGSIAGVAAASSLALAAAAALVMGLRGGASPVASSPPETVAPPARAASVAGERDFQGAEQVLATELATRRGSMPPDEVAVIDDNLRIVDDAIASTREALQANPEDLELRAELDHAWEDKLDLLQQATELPPEK